MIYDFIVIGAGAAGLTFVDKIIKSNNGIKIALVEAGNLKNDALNDYKDISFVKKKINPVDEKRAFLFGGTTNQWGGFCRPLDYEDFIPRNDINKNEWPFDINELNKYLDEAKKVLELSENFKIKSKPKENKTLTDFNLEEIDFDYSNKQIFFNKYRNLNNKIDIYLNNIAYKFIIDEQNRSVKSLDIIEAKTKSKKRIYSKNFILSLGGLETTRFLLNNNNFYKQNYFNKSKTLGKGFNDHPHFYVGDFVSFKDFHKTNKIKSVRYFKNTYKFQIENKILNSSIRLTSIKNPVDTNYNLIKEFKNLFPKITKKILYTGRIMVVSEQHSISENMMELDNTKKDNFGIPKINFKYELTKFDLENIRKTSINISKWLASSEHGRAKLLNWIMDENLMPNSNDYMWYGHHMGTTRMGLNANSSVVDHNLKIHSLNNAYIVSSSTFPSGGASNPTFTIVQLALRLAKHLKTIS